ncbi:helix-turn-helix transcriptional regulator [Conexibacter stalactiti]|uniref:helix-turn-helix transcriptional regulator n=1 Tax=Conexibacter stalactiti TaxID=1940611 RepID=UPI00384E541E
MAARAQRPRLAPALRSMHSDPARRWHVEDLAQACGMSRTTFETRFKAAAGIRADGLPPRLAHSSGPARPAG